MSEVLDELLIRIDTQVDKAIASLGLVDKSMGSLEKHVASAASKVRSGTMMMLGYFKKLAKWAGVGLAAALGWSIKTFADFEQTVANAASVTGASGEAYEDVKDNIEDMSKALGATTVFSASQAADALYDLASAGYDVGDMVSGDMKPVLDLAAATQSDLTETTQSVTSTLGQFGLTIQDSQRVADVFARTIGSSKATLEKITLSMRYVGNVAHTLGIEIEQVNSYLGVLYDNGFRGEMAGRALRAGISRLLKPTAEAKEVLGELSIPLSQVNPEMTDLTEILKTLEGKSISANQAMRLFGIEAAPAMLALINNTSGIDDLRATLDDAGGSAEYMAEKQLDTLHGSAILLKSILEVLRIEIGERLAPYLVKLNKRLWELTATVMDKVDPAFDKFDQIIKDLQPTWDNLKRIVEASIGIFKDLWEMFTGGEVTSSTLTETINNLTDKIAGLLEWIDRHPSVTKFVAVLVTAAVVFSFLLPIVTAIGTALGVLGTIVGAVAAVMGGTVTVGTALGAVIAALGGPITIIVALIALLAAAWATNLFGIRDKTAATVDFLKDKFAGLVNFIGPLLTGVYNKIAEVWNKMLPFINEGGFDHKPMAIQQWTDVDFTPEKPVEPAIDNEFTPGILSGAPAMAGMTMAPSTMPIQDLKLDLNPEEIAKALTGDGQPLEVGMAEVNEVQVRHNDTYDVDVHIAKVIQQGGMGGFGRQIKDSINAANGGGA